MKKVLIVGGGPAGMCAAIFAARSGREVCLFEKNEKLGKKLFLTGKGRCNLTNACSTEELFGAVVSNEKFLYSSFYGFTNQDLMDFFEDLGLRLKTERGNRVFPLSDHSSDAIRALEREMSRAGVKVYLHADVQHICTEPPSSAEDAKEGAAMPEERRVCGLKLKDGRFFPGEACILATGGLSYPSTGSDGDGYRMAEELGHTVTELRPSLVPIETAEDFAGELMGLSLRNVELRVMEGKKTLYSDFGELLFTHFGVSGPLILTASAYVGRRLEAGASLRLRIDLKPALSIEQLDARILREFEANRNRQFKNALSSLFPAKLIPVMVRLSGILPEKKVHEITREERQGFVRLIKNLELTPTRLRGYEEAIITQGGVRVKEVDPGTMESRLVKGLYFAGELLDLDAVTGGFNLQIAWSTGCAAGRNV